MSDDVDVDVDNIVNIKEENFDLDLNDLLTADEDTFNEIDTGKPTLNMIKNENYK